ncbi:hypothetical protein WJX73_001525 [Symbiochloris irregularis]|uniref:Extradiol ring-cleavage dioxygenase class III enzyme subunit B domain-containing protein n=1 Tax=Symbiochloris irregularis TaxID=706552 RepID=A0AAW1NX25_9CHLO
MTSAAPPLLYDYYGFPAAAYKLSWPAPGSPELGKRVQEVLGSAGIKSAANAKRGFDHGTFVPLMMAYPKADVPTVQLSLNANLDPRQHLAIGRALQPLRDEGVYIIASGMTYHNMAGFRHEHGSEDSQVFSDWLVDVVTKRSDGERAELLEQWEQGPKARAAHPREEHLMPLMVAVGAAGSDAGSVAFDGSHMGMRCLSFMFG